LTSSTTPAWATPSRQRARRGQDDRRGGPRTAHRPRRAAALVRGATNSVAFGARPWWCGAEPAPEWAHTGLKRRAHGWCAQSRLRPLRTPMRDGPEQGRRFRGSGFQGALCVFHHQGDNTTSDKMLAWLLWSCDAPFNKFMDLEMQFSSSWTYVILLDKFKSRSCI
jgi:hypothetical protein